MTEVQFAKQFLTALDSKNTKYQSDHVFDPETFQMRIPYTLPKLSHPPHPLPPKPAGATTTPAAPGSEPFTQDSIPPPSIDVTLKSTRNPAFTLHLPSLPPSTPINTLKAQVQSLLSPNGPGTPDKIKILHNKKPTPASKSTVHDVLTSDPSSDASSLPSTVEFGVMVLGGAPDPSPTTQTVNLNNTVQPGTTSSDGEKIPAPGPGSENAAVEASTGVNPEDVMKGLEKTTAAGAAQQASNEASGRAVLDTPEFWDDLQGFLEQRVRDSGEAARLRGLFEQAAQS